MWSAFAGRMMKQPYSARCRRRRRHWFHSTPRMVRSKRSQAVSRLARATTTVPSRPSANPGQASNRSFTAQRWTRATPPRAWSTIPPSSLSNRAWTASGARRTTTIRSSDRSACARRCTNRGIWFRFVCCRQWASTTRSITSAASVSIRRTCRATYLWHWVRQRLHLWRSPPAGRPLQTAGTRSSHT